MERFPIGSTELRPLFEQFLSAHMECCYSGLSVVPKLSGHSLRDKLGCLDYHVLPKLKQLNTLLYVWYILPSKMYMR
jgi:hypothetical protein